MKIGDKVKTPKFVGRICATCGPDQTALVEHWVDDGSGFQKVRLVSNWLAWEQLELVPEPAIQPQGA